jgi:hypothetical protein
MPAKYKFMKIRFTLVLFILLDLSLKAQNITVGSIDMIEQRSRNEQLLGNANPLISYTLRPLDTELIDSTQTKSDKKIYIKILPITLTLQNNSNAPSGWNDGSMIPAKGYQSLISAGLFAEYKFLSVQFKPEHVYAENPNFGIYSLYAGDRARTINVGYLNQIDLPAPFGDRSYNKLSWGQSNIKLNVNKFSLGYPLKTYGGDQEIEIH